MPSLINDFFTVIIWFFYEECIYLPHMCFRVDYVTSGCFSFVMLIDVNLWFLTDLVGNLSDLFSSNHNHLSKFNPYQSNWDHRLFAFPVEQS